MEKDRVAIIGAGKVGTAVGNLLRSSGYSVVALADVSGEALRRALEYTGGSTFTDAADAAALADIIIITTPDDLIAPVCRHMADRGTVGSGKRVVHMSGAGGLDLLESATRRGALAASIHPLQSFIDVAGVIAALPGSIFAVTAHDEIRDWAVSVVTDLGGIPFFVDDEDKPLYHAAACVASNYLVALMHIVTSLYSLLGLSHDEAARSFRPLIRGTMANMETKGIDQSLTGPIARGDVTTIEKHLAVLAAKAPHYLQIYRELGRVAADIAGNMKTISVEKKQELESLLKGDHRHE